jgi:hypothetical protein
VSDILVGVQYDYERHQSSKPSHVCGLRFGSINSEGFAGRDIQPAENCTRRHFNWANLAVCDAQ